MSQKQSRSKATSQHRNSTPRRKPSRPVELAKALEHVGLFSRVAKRGGWTLGHVLQVAKGKHQSQLVIDAIVAEVRRIELEAEKVA